MSDVTIDTSDFDRDLEDYINSLLPQGLERGVKKACLVVEGSAKGKAGINFGQLRAGIKSETEINGSEIDGYVSANTEYALFHHEGTGIYAKGGNGRKTDWFYKNEKGEWIKTAGQKANPFLEDAVKENKDKISSVIEQSLK
ncbi:HK97 gp10 family phage protein [uncultured Clostridium sp.]|uniref:HK97 gp10 family phage protein n=1 Tax=uncultured Clostridium sp. TaxID=59620 RepID=UPI002624824F|nr:HK97 gp10 family phage protein [uncultured Clostridium sp.]